MLGKCLCTCYVRLCHELEATQKSKDARFQLQMMAGKGSSCTQGQLAAIKHRNRREVMTPFVAIDGVFIPRPPPLNASLTDCSCGVCGWRITISLCSCFVISRVDSRCPYYFLSSPCFFGLLLALLDDISFPLFGHAICFVVSTNCCLPVCMFLCSCTNISMLKP